MEHVLAALNGLVDLGLVVEVQDDPLDLVPGLCSVCLLQLLSLAVAPDASSDPELLRALLYEVLADPIANVPCDASH